MVNSIAIAWYNMHLKMELSILSLGVSMETQKHPEQNHMSEPGPVRRKL